MRDGWQTATLGEVASISIGRTPPRNEPRYWTQSLDRPFCTIADMTAPVIVPVHEGVTETAEHEGKAKRVERGTLLMSFKLTLGRVGFAGVDVFPNEAIAAIRPTLGALDSRYLALWLGHLDLEASAGRAVKGKTLNSESLRSIAVEFPPPDDQRRIVDLVAAVDEAADRAHGTSAATWDALDAFLAARVADPNTSGAPVESLLALDIGGVWGADPGRGERDVAVYRSTEFGADGWATPNSAAVRAVSVGQMTSRALRNADVLLEKSGGTPTRPVGRVVRCPEPLVPSIIANFVQLLRPDTSKVEPSFLFWLLWSWHRRGIPALYQTATTNIRNLRTREYLALRADVPTRAAQRTISSAADGLQAVAIAAAQLASRLRQFRSALLNDLLSGDHEIPASYDRFLDGAT